MKHTIEIEGLPEGYEIEKVIIKDKMPCLNGSIASSVYVKKKQPRRIVLEETEETRQPIAGEYVFNNGNLCLCRKPERWGNEHEIWRIVEDSGEKNDD